MAVIFHILSCFHTNKKLLNISKLSEVEVLDVMYLNIEANYFVNEVSMPSEIYSNAYQLTKDIDEKDTIFVAMSLFLNCTIWSGKHCWKV